MSGALCFRGTRIPVSILFDYLGADGLAEFREGYPDVSEAQVGRCSPTRGSASRSDTLPEPPHEDSVGNNLHVHYGRELDPRHAVVYCRDLGGQTLRNGDLVREADGRFDVMLTIDKNMAFQDELARPESCRARPRCEKQRIGRATAVRTWSRGSLIEAEAGAVHLVTALRVGGRG